MEQQQQQYIPTGDKHQLNRIITYNNQLYQIQQEVSGIDEEIQDIAKQREDLLEEKTRIINELKGILKLFKKKSKKNKNEEYDSDEEEEDDEVGNDDDEQLQEDYEDGDIFNKSMFDGIKAENSIYCQKPQRNNEVRSKKKEEQEYENFVESTKTFLTKFKGPKSYPAQLKEKLLEFASKFGMKKLGRDTGVSYANLKTWKRNSLLKNHF